MLPFILAALIAATPVHPTPQTNSNLPDVEDASTTTEAQIDVQACIALGSGEATADQVTQALHLDTPEKVHGFIVSCKSFLIGVGVGRQISTPRTPA